MIAITSNLNGHSKAYLVSIAVLGERFSFWGLQAVMVLFLMQVFFQNEKNAFSLIGAFGALSYMIALVGDMLADKLFGFWKSCLFGLFLCALGNIIIFSSYGFSHFIFGLSCILVGAGLFSPNSNSLNEKGFVISLFIKILIGLIISAVGFLFFAYAEWCAQQKGLCGMEGIILGNFCLGLGEIFLYPPILSNIAHFSPKRFAGTLMGMFSISLALASYFSGHFASIVSRYWINPIPSNKSIFKLAYADISFFLFGIFIISGIIFYFLRKWYNKQVLLIET
jgi:dipeptide/tripeptide permease